MEFIFGNIFFVIIIIGIILKFIGGGSEAKTDEQNQQEGQSTKPVRRRIFDEIKKVEEMFQPETTSQDSPEATSKGSAEAQRQKQLERLKQNYAPMENTEDDDIAKHSGLQTRRQQSTNTKKVTKKDLHLKKRLSRGGLKESIIMAEVLGPPRAYHPYQNIAQNRRR